LRISLGDLWIKESPFYSDCQNNVPNDVMQERAMSAIRRTGRGHGPFIQKIAEHPSEQIYDNHSITVFFWPR
jgi:hypothetical protein